MTEINARISDMRQASAIMRTASLNIQTSFTAVQNLVRTLPPAMQDALLMQVGYSTVLDSNSWTQQLLQFAARLEEAAADIERAARAGQASLAALSTDELALARPGDRGTTFGDILPPLFDDGDDDKQAALAPPPALDEYLSEANQPVYRTLREHEEQLADQQARLEALDIIHQDRISDLAALENRLRTNGVENIDSIARVQALRGEIDLIDSAIAETQTEIDSLTETVGLLEGRLEMVKPGAGANLGLIASMEHAETSEWIKANTYGCVKHIANRMPIPAGIANDAYLWNDNAQRLVEYGIRSGDVPLTGSVLVMEIDHSYSDDQYGHLLYVEQVVDGEVWVTDHEHLEPVRLAELTDEVSGPNMQYLYFPWHTRVS